MMPAAETPSKTDRGWLEPVIWSLVLITTIITAACYNAAFREILAQGMAYLFAFLTTPFILETSTAFMGLLIVFFINSRRIAREGDGWVMMEVKTEETAEKKETGV